MTDLLSLLEKIQNNSEQLFSCLKQEKMALDANQFEQLNEISSQKQTLLVQLGDLDQQRAAKSPTQNFNDFVASSVNPKLIKQWEITRQVIANCQKQNTINGRLLNKRAEVNQDILSILTGRDLQTDSTYNANGSQTNGASLLNGIKA